MWQAQAPSALQPACKWVLPLLLQQCPYALQLAHLCLSAATTLLQTCRTCWVSRVRAS